MLKNAQKVSSTTLKQTHVIHVTTVVKLVPDHYQLIAQAAMKDYYYTKENVLKFAHQDSSLITKPKHVTHVTILA